jgi:hypothetical protein
MSWVGRADEGDRNCGLGKAERQRGRRCRSMSSGTLGEDLPGDHDGAAVCRAPQVNEQILMVWTKRCLNCFNAFIGSTGQGRLIVA